MTGSPVPSSTLDMVVLAVLAEKMSAILDCSLLMIDKQPSLNTCQRTGSVLHTVRFADVLWITKVPWGWEGGILTLEINGSKVIIEVLIFNIKTRGAGLLVCLCVYQHLGGSQWDNIYVRRILGSF